MPLPTGRRHHAGRPGAVCRQGRWKDSSTSPSRRKLSPRAATRGSTWLVWARMAFSLAVEELALEDGVDHELVHRRARGLGAHEDVDPVQRLAELRQPLGGVRGVGQQGVRRRLRVRSRGPPADADVVGVTGHPVRPEREHGVGPDALHDAGQHVDRLAVVDLGAVPVRVVQPLVLGDSEHRERPLHLGGAYGGQRRAGRPALLVGGAELAPGGGDADDARAVADGAGHQPAAELGLVIGVRPDAEDGAQLVGHGEKT